MGQANSWVTAENNRAIELGEADPQRQKAHQVREKTVREPWSHCCPWGPPTCPRPALREVMSEASHHRGERRHCSAPAGKHISQQGHKP